MNAKLYSVLSGAAGIGAAFLARKLVSTLWPGENDPPLNPADRRIRWSEALAWAVATAVGAAVARVVAMRGAAAGWTKATGETPPGVKA